MNPLDVAFRRFFVYQIRRRQTKHAQCGFYPKKCSYCDFSEKWAKSFNIQYSPFIAMFIGQEKIWTDSNASKVH